MTHSYQTGFLPARICELLRYNPHIAAFVILEHTDNSG
jgi:hypothetical protein